MGILFITNNIKTMGLIMPWQVLINGQLVGVAQVPQVQIQLPDGRYDVTIRVGGELPFGEKGKRVRLGVSSTAPVQVNSGCTRLDVHEKGRWWDILFTLDLVAYIVMLFVTVPSPWNVVYHVLSNGFFALWLIRLFVMRKNYYRLEVYPVVRPTEDERATMSK